MKRGFFQRALNFKSCLFRLTLVISIILSTLLGRGAARLADQSYSGWFHFLTTLFDGGSIHYISDFQLGNFLAVFIGTFSIIWMIYLTLYWIAIGFKSRE